MSGYTYKARAKKPAYKKNYVKPALMPGIQRQVNALVRKQDEEKKGMDTTFNQTSVSAVLSGNDDSTCLNLVQMGTGSWNRVGRKIFLKSVRLRGEIINKFTPQTGSLNANTFRMIVVWDKQPSGGVIPGFNTIFGHTTQTGAESAGLWDSVRYDNMQRFQILRDITFDAQPKIYSSAVSTEVHSFDEYIKLNGKETVYSGQADPMTWADISTGGLLVVVRALFAAENNEFSLSNCVARLRYTD